MFASHLVLGLALLVFAVWLQRTESRGWPHEVSEGKDDEVYFRRRRRSRGRVNFLIAVCGSLIVVAGSSGPRLFAVCWLLVIIVLLVVMLLAAMDVIGTRRHMNSKLPDLRRRILGDDRDDEP